MIHSSTTPFEKRYRRPQIAFYGLGLNSSIILNAIGFGSPSKSLIGGIKVYTNLKNIGIGSMILSVAGLIPSYWVAFLFIDRWGRRPIQLTGFCALTVLLLIMGMLPSLRHTCSRMLIHVRLQASRTAD